MVDPTKIQIPKRAGPRYRVRIGVVIKATAMRTTVSAYFDTALRAKRLGSSTAAGSEFAFPPATTRPLCRVE